MAANPVLDLAYDAARAALHEQDTTLANVRNRAAGLLSTSTVATTVAAAVGLLNNDPARGAVFPAWAGWILLLGLIIVGIGVMAVLWPVAHWKYGPAPGKLLSVAEQDIDSVRRSATEAMIKFIEANDKRLRGRMLIFQAAAAVFVTEIVVLAGLLALKGR
jgi:hypothetical protein